MPDTSKHVEWWRSAATHMWRTYFSMITAQQDAITNNLPTPPVTDSQQRMFDTCDSIFRNRFTPADQNILKMYYTSPWGEDLNLVYDYSRKHNIPASVIWIVIKKAGRYAMQDIGLLEKQNIVGGDTHDK